MFGEGGNLHCQEGTFPSHTHRHSQSSESQPSWTTVCLWWTPELHETPPPTDALRLTPGLLWTYTEEEHCKTHRHKKNTRTHTECWWKNGQTDRLLTNCWLQAGSSREPLKGVVFLECVCRDQRSTARKKEEDKDSSVFPSLCTERDVEYRNDPKVEEVVSHQHSILVLHDLLQVDCTSLMWSSLYKCIILIDHFWTFTDTNIVQH